MEFTKEVLIEKDVHLVVLYGLDENHETPREGWKTLLTNLGVDHTKNLKYLSQFLRTKDDILSLLPPLISTTTTTTTPTTTTPTTTPTTTTTTPTTTTTTTTTTPTTTTTTIKESSTTTTKTVITTTLTSTEHPTTQPTIMSTRTATRPPEDETTGDNSSDHSKCPGKGCWNGKGMYLVVDEKPKFLNLRIVS